MSLLGGIQVRIGADTSGLESGMKRAGNTVKRGAKQLRDSANQYAKWGAAAAAASAVAAAAIYRSTSQQIDQLAKTSDRLGIATENLQALQFAAEQTGVETRTLEMGLQRMTRRISEAAQGSGEAKDAIKELGLEARSLSQLPLEKQFMAIAGAMESVTNQGDRVRLAMRLFDSEGVALINTLDAGEEGLKAFADEAQRLGLNLTRVDAAGVEAANDAINRAQMMIRGQLQQAVVDLAPFIESISDQFTEAGANVDNFGDLALDAAEMVAQGFGWIGDALRGNEISIAASEVAYLEFKKVGVGVAQDVAEAVERMANGAVAALNGMINSLNNIPGVDIEPIGQLQLDATKQWNDLLVDTNQELYEAQSAAIALAEQPLPSENIEAWFNRVREGAAEAKAAMNNVTGGGMDTGEGEGEGEDGEPAKFSPEENERFLEGLRERFATEEEIVNQKMEKDLARLQEFSDKELEIVGGREAAISKIEEEAAEQRKKIKDMESKAMLNSVSSGLGAISTLMNSESKKQFEIGKKASMAQAVVKGWSAAQSAWDAGMSTGGPWAPAIAAAYTAASLAKTGAQLSAIKSTSFGSSNQSGNAGGSSVPNPNTAAGGQGGGGQGGGGRNISISLQGSSFTDEQVRDLIGRINDQAGDGVTLATSS